MRAGDAAGESAARGANAVRARVHRLHGGPHVVRGTPPLRGAHGGVGRRAPDRLDGARTDQSDPRAPLATPETRLVERIAAVRGSPIECYGAMDLLLCDALGAARRIMQADQTVYLHPSRVDLVNAEAMRVGEHNFPDVVLEVDHTTDVRRGKLRLYESWGFPELWVEVPAGRAPSRPESRLPGLTIHLLERGAYRSSPVSRAFPGWTAQAIHDAMNEPAPSARTHAILEGVGRALGAREGTGPDDDPLLRSLRDQSRAEGRQKDRAEGEARGRAGMVCAILASRGIDVSEGFPANVPAFAESPVAVCRRGGAPLRERAGLPQAHPRALIPRGRRSTAQQWRAFTPCAIGHRAEGSHRCGSTPE